MHFSGRLEQQIGQRRMQVVSRDVLHRGADELHVLAGNVFAEIERAPRQLQLVQVGNAACIAIGLRDVEEVDLRCAQQLANQLRGCGVAHGEEAVDAALGQRLHGLVRRRIDVRGAVARLDAVRRQQRVGQAVAAAALRADVEPQALELRQQVPGRAAIEDHQRLVRDAAQRHQVLRGGAVGLAAQHEAHVYRDLRVRQSLQVVVRAFGGQDLQRDALLGQDLLVLLGVPFEPAALGPARDGERARRGGVEEPERHQARHDAQQKNQARGQHRPLSELAIEPRKDSRQVSSSSNHVQPLGEISSKGCEFKGRPKGRTPLACPRRGTVLASPTAMRGLLSRTLGRLSVGRKLLLIYLLDLTAVIFISGVLINEKFIAIDFARKELAGNAYIAQARAALLAVVQAAPAVRTGEAPAALVMRAEGASGAGMRSAGLSEAFAAALDRLDVARRAGAPDALEHTRREALDRGRELLTRIGNQSNLILDPDLDSYYTMSIVLLRLPELLDLGSSIAGQLRHQVALGHVPDAAARTQFFILEGRLDATAKGVESDYAEAFAAAADGVLGSALQPSRAALAASIERFRASARALLDGASEAELQRLDAAEAALLRDIDGAWRQSATQLDRLLQVRIAGFFTLMWLHLGTALALLALILGAVFFVARQIALPLRRLSDVVDTVRRTGDHSLRAQWPSGDEIGRLVLGFNDMLAQLDRERAAQQELAASARAAAAQQELVEAMPMPMMVTAVPGHEVLHANASAQRWLGGRRQDPWASGLDADLRVRFFQELADRERVDEFEVRWHAGAKPSWAVLSARRLRYQGQDAVLTAFAPINHLKQMEQRLALWAKVFETSSEGIVIVDGERRIVSVNRALSRATGYDAAELIGQRLDTLVSDDAGSTPLVGLWLQIEQRDAWQGEVQVRRRDGSSYPAWLVVSVERSDAGRVSHVIFASIDISERKANEQRIQFLAQHDALTELPNRSLCSER